MIRVALSLILEPPGSLGLWLPAVVSCWDLLRGAFAAEICRGSLIAANPRTLEARVLKRLERYYLQLRLTRG